ncbi:MAG TPA: Cof-type HAD-IIB family hydrolase [Chloroflexi bacterium]|nr:Cof-type HAD-IIB family hydrolase [Chloroflexota bacterium]
MTYRLLALDLDGTVMGRSSAISPRIKRTIERALEKGVVVTLATGRVFGSALPFAQELGIRAPIISSQGAMIRAPLKRPLAEWTIPLALAHRLIAVGREAGLQLSAYVGDILCLESQGPQVYPPSVEVKVVEDLFSSLPGEPHKMRFEGDEGVIWTLASLLPEQFRGLLNLARPDPFSLQATHREASKGQGLAYLARHLGIPREEVMAIGDYDNDVDMVAWAGLGVAMGNASPRLLAVADEVVPPLDEEGAAVAIERYILK